MVIFLTYFEPMESRFTNRMEVFNECTCIVLMYHIMCFSDFVPNPATRSSIGISFIVTIFSNVFVHLYFMFKDNFVRIKQKVMRKCCYERWKKNALKLQRKKREAMAQVLENNQNAMTTIRKNVLKQLSRARTGEPDSADSYVAEDHKSSLGDIREEDSKLEISAEIDERNEEAVNVAIPQVDLEAGPLDQFRSTFIVPEKVDWEKEMDDVMKEFGQDSENEEAEAQAVPEKAKAATNLTLFPSMLERYQAS